MYMYSENKGTDQLRSNCAAKLICALIFAYANCWFSHEAAQMICFLFAYSKQTADMQRFFIVYNFDGIESPL